CTATKVCFQYFNNPESRLFQQGHNAMQCYFQGNVLILPQDTAVLNNILPPPIDDVKNSFMTLFAGQEAPTADVLRKLQPVKANVSIVCTMLDFLLTHNNTYTCSTIDFPQGTSFSDDYFNTIFPTNQSIGTNSLHILPCIEIGYVRTEPAQVASESDIGSRNVFEDSVIEENNFLVEVSGYSTSNCTAASYKAMKANTLAHCLDDHGSFLLSQKGNHAIHNLCNEYTLTWMFPHLDPFALGGFNDPRRWHLVSMGKQLAHLMRLADRRFQHDPSFAYIFHSILQRWDALRDVRFRLPEGRHQAIVENLLNVNLDVFADFSR
ncbi:hypothetical protein CALCODRAFT_429880, partial [Calocera cornea HHB12733]